MSAVINFEYFISPLICEDVNIVNHVNGMRILKELISSCDVDIFAEDEILLKMSKEEYYPCEKVLNRAFPKGDDCVYSSQDVARLINNIIDALDEFDSNLSSHDIEWSDFSTYPEVLSISERRKEGIICFLKKIAVSRSVLGQSYDIFYDQPKIEDGEIFDRFHLNGNISDSFPEIPDHLKNNLECEVKTFGKSQSYFQNVDAMLLYSQSDNLRALKCSFYCGCLAFINRNELNIDFDWDSFTIGADFLESLNRNQGGPFQEFAAVVFNTVVQVLCRQPKNGVSIFKKSAKSTDQKTLGTLKAYRTHITNSHQALRLMFWVDVDKTIVLANIGTKFEEKISNP